MALKTDQLSDKYSIPELPRGYKPKSAIAGVSTLPKLYGRMDKTLRGLIIGGAGKGTEIYSTTLIIFYKFIICKTFVCEDE